MSETDIVSDIVARIEAAVREYLSQDRGFEENVVTEVCKQIQAQEKPARQYWHGARPYIPLRSSEDQEKKQAALEDVNRTGKVAIAADKHGISRATMYRLLKR